MTELPWFPLYARDWLAGEGTSMMLPEQEGPFIRLLCIAWGDGTAEPSLPDDDAALATMTRLGARWKRFGSLIRAQFTEREGRLYNDKLSSVWMEQRRRSAKLAENGRKGGRAKAGLKPGHDLASSPDVANGKHTEAEADTENNSSLHDAAESAERRQSQFNCDEAIAELSALLTEIPGADGALTGFMEGLPSAAKRLVWARSLITSLRPLAGGRSIQPVALVAAMSDFNLTDRARFPYTGAVFRAFADKAMRDLEAPAPGPRGAVKQALDPTVAALEQWKRETDERETREKSHA